MVFVVFFGFFLCDFLWILRIMWYVFGLVCYRVSVLMSCVFVAVMGCIFAILGLFFLLYFLLYNGNVFSLVFVNMGVPFFVWIIHLYNTK